MYHNSFDLELHARFMRERAMEEAERSRRADEAYHVRTRDRRFRLPRATVIRAWVLSLTAPRSAAQPVRRPVQSDTEIIELRPVKAPEYPQRPQAAHPIANPYAGMVILARGKTQRAGRSSNVKEC